jgi:hypothetical protein
MFNEYDAVVLNKPLPDSAAWLKGIWTVPVGSEGCIVGISVEDHAYHVEFFDQNYKTIGLFTVGDEYLELKST